MRVPADRTCLLPPLLLSILTNCFTKNEPVPPPVPRRFHPDLVERSLRPWSTPKPRTSPTSVSASFVAMLMNYAPQVGKRLRTVCMSSSPAVAESDLSSSKISSSSSPAVAESELSVEEYSSRISSKLAEIKALKQERLLLLSKVRRFKRLRR